MLNIGPGLYLTTSAFVLLCLHWCRKYRDRSHPPLPPGPSNLPVLGSVLSLHNPTRPWLDFTAWKSTYGDIIFARLLSKSVVVVNSEEVARDLFDLRSNIYSDRPQSIVYKHFAIDFGMPFMPYGDRWRLHRRIFHHSFRPAIIPTYHTGLLRSVHEMLFRFLQDPTDYIGHFHLFTASFVLSIVYDYQQKGENDHIVLMIRKYLELVTAVLGLGTTAMIEALSFLLKLPVWFPGATFKRTSVMCLQSCHDMKEIPFLHTKEKMSNEEMPMPSCVVADSMVTMNGFENAAMETAIKDVAGTAFAAANETTTGTLLVFLLAMALHPDVQAKAQADIDRVVGKDRLPNFSDRPALPYIDAIMREIIRWYPVLPMGLPHSTTTEDTYKGYFIPKGVIVTANIWAMTHDEKKYPSPNEFKPERFFNEDGSLTDDKMILGFGWGRRICVGRHLADAAVWIALANLLATFSVHKALDESGREIPIVPKFSTGITVHVEKFPCRIIPRFDDASPERLKELIDLSK